MVKAGCQDCQGCFSLDCFHLMKATQKSFEELLTSYVSLHVEDGIILPHVAMNGTADRCSFLSDEGRCTIHEYRPGLCRLFPLGREYIDGKIQYFVLDNACSMKQHTKVKVSKWIAMEDVTDYESFLCEWHSYVKEMKEYVLHCKSDEEIKKMNLSLLQIFYLNPYDLNEDFMEQFQKRMEIIITQNKSESPENSMA